MKKVKFYILLSLLFAFLAVGVWDVHLIRHSLRDYHEKLELQANQLFTLRQEKIVLLLVSQENLALKEEIAIFMQMFPALKKASIYVQEGNLFFGPSFTPQKKRIKKSSFFDIEITYPLYISNLYLGNVYFYIKEKAFASEFLLSILFFFILVIAFIVGTILTVRNFKLEKRVLAQASEMNSYVSYIVHELKNPLTAINNLAYVLKKYSQEKSGVEIGRRIGSIAINLEEKINYLLNLARIDFSLMKKESQEIYLKPLVDKYLDKIADLILEKKLLLKNHIDSKIKIVASERILEIILTNLISNAIKYTPEGEVSLKTFPQEEELHLIIEDTGIGIPLAEQEKVFEMYYRTPLSTKVEKGTGIGLYLTRRLVHEMEWKIKIKSPILPKGRGSRISIIIPYP